MIASTTVAVDVRRFPRDLCHETAEAPPAVLLSNSLPTSAKREQNLGGAWALGGQHDSLLTGGGGSSRREPSRFSGAAFAGPVHCGVAALSVLLSNSLSRPAKREQNLRGGAGAAGRQRPSRAERWRHRRDPVLRCLSGSRATRCSSASRTLCRDERIREPRARQNPSPTQTLTVHRDSRVSAGNARTHPACTCATRQPSLREQFESCAARTHRGPVFAFTQCAPTNVIAEASARATNDGTPQALPTSSPIPRRYGARPDATSPAGCRTPSAKGAYRLRRAPLTPPGTNVEVPHSYRGRDLSPQ